MILLHFAKPWYILPLPPIPYPFRRLLRRLQSSPKILESLRGYNNIAKGSGKTNGSRIFQSVSRFLSKID